MKLVLSLALACLLGVSGASAASHAGDPQSVRLKDIDEARIAPGIQTNVKDYTANVIGTMGTAKAETVRVILETKQQVLKDTMKDLLVRGDAAAQLVTAMKAGLAPSATMSYSGLTAISTSSLNSYCEAIQKTNATLIAVAGFFDLLLADLVSATKTIVELDLMFNDNRDAIIIAIIQKQLTTLVQKTPDANLDGINAKIAALQQAQAAIEKADAKIKKSLVDISVAASTAGIGDAALKAKQ